MYICVIKHQNWFWLMENLEKKKILILFAHLRFEQSRCNSVLVRSIPDDPNITFHDLYEIYPDFNIDIDHEKQLLLKHDIIHLAPSFLLVQCTAAFETMDRYGVGIWLGLWPRG